MKTTDTFTYKSKYSEYPNCWFEVNRYGTNGNLALSINDDEGMVCMCSVNTDVKLDDDSIGIKNYSENEGMDDFLINLGLIENAPFDFVGSGFVTIPFYKLTDSGKELFEIVRSAPF